MEWWEDYGNLISKICPDYEVGLQTVVNGIIENPRRILELGTGTGNLTAKLAERFPEASISSIEKDNIMFSKAEERLGGYSTVTLIKSDAADADVEGYEVVVSSLLLHLMPKGQREKLLSNIYYSTARSIVVFDRVKGETPEQEESFLQYFANQLEGKGLPEKLVQDLRTESRNNSPMSLSEIRKMFEPKFSFEVLHQNPSHGFMVYRGLRNV